MSDAELAAHLAQVAGHLLCTVRDCEIFEDPANKKALGKAGDATANE
ncbi:MAG: 3'(2'),5'-bisphosphate nucleotidase CysQ, partial [Pseudomonadota bacterium]